MVDSSNTAENSASGAWWKRSVSAAIKGGASGSIAMVLQVVLLMWLRTIVNYQYRHGVGVARAASNLYREGGILRFYRGASVALLTGPIARFGDTAANEGIKELMGNNNNKSKQRLPVWATTLVASLVAALWRVAITPLDTLKTTLQVGSASGQAALATKLRNHGVGVLWDGALGNSLATLAGHYPWFIVHNFLDARLPQPKKPLEQDGAPMALQQRHRRLQLLRRAFIGFCSSFASDCISNGIRVVKTYQQTAATPLSYSEALFELLQAEGFQFVVRGLKLKILSNGLSGIIFAVLWKLILEQLNQHTKEKQPAKGGSDGDTPTQDGFDDNDKSKTA
jgi:hypothetical protein